MRNFYPKIEAYAVHQLPVDDLHSLYLEESGNPHGLPIVFLHGGPGAGCDDYHRQFFNPQKYRIILFDQRGCGRSVPHAELKNNTTWDLVADMEKIRQFLGIDRWALFGGSWGSTLALAYAQTHPQCVTGLVLRGIFLARPMDIQWFYQQGTSRLFPDYWQDYLKPIAEDERHGLVSAYYRRLTSVDESERLEAAMAWSIWEGLTATLQPDEAVIRHFSHPHAALSIARIECHYFMNDSFLEPDQLLRDIDKIAHIPGYLVQGRYDVICPMEQAYALHQAWPGSELRVLPTAGHAVVEEGITNALIEITDELAERLSE